MRRPISGTPRADQWLWPATRLAQQLTIAAAHQGQSSFHQTDRAVAQVVGLPGTFGDPLGAEQALSDRAIAVAFDAGVERAQDKRQSLAPLWGQLMECRTGRASVKDPPEPLRGAGANLEIVIKRQFGSVGLLRNRRLSQPQPMLRPAKTQEDMPAVRRRPDFASRHFDQTEPISIGRNRAPNNRNDCRQNFRCPEDGLILRRPRRVSRKSRGPISF
jgi:hypothetical protein